MDSSKSELTYDGLHPNAEGYAVMRPSPKPPSPCPLSSNLDPHVFHRSQTSNLTPYSLCATFLPSFLRVWLFLSPTARGGIHRPPGSRNRQPATWMRRTIHITGKIEPFFGTLDENIRTLEDSLHVRTHLHDTRLTIEGEQGLCRPDCAHRRGVQPSHPSWPRPFQRRSESTFCASPPMSRTNLLAGCFEHARTRSFGKENRYPEERKSEALHGRDRKSRHDFRHWPRRHRPKTYLAVAMAVSALLTKQVNRIILARPAVEAGERLGFLPGHAATENRSVHASAL